MCCDTSANARAGKINSLGMNNRFVTLLRGTVDVEAAYACTLFSLWECRADFTASVG
jgi:hypothetical protein